MKTIKNNFTIIGYVARFCPVMIIFSLLHIIASVGLSISKLFLVKKAIQIVQLAITNNDFSSDNLNVLYKSLVVYLIIIVITSLFRTFYTSYISVRYRTIYIKKMQQFLFKKVRKIDMESFDNPEFYDNYSRALRDGVSRGIRVYEELIKFVTSISITIAMGAIIITEDLILVSIILASSIINLLVINKVNRKWYEWSKETETDRRMYNYINRTFYRQKYAGEIKTTPISDLLIRKYKESAEVINKKYAKTYRKVLWLRTGYNISRGFLEQGGSYAYLGYKLFKHFITIDAFTYILNATLQFSSNFLDAINFLNTLRDNSFYIDDFLWLVHYQPKLEDQKGQIIEETTDLSIEDVGFKYPDTDVFSIDGLNLHFKKGEKIAIVGPNGGGKTTLTKLLLHFYLPTNGDIKANKISYQALDIEALRKRYAVVFQDFQIYALTIGENVLMRKLLTPEDEQIVWNALDKVGMKEKIMKLELGIHTQVTREFNRNGAVFSGGEVQRIAIARVFASDADIYILDEPTSSLDPLSEERINKLIIKNTDKTMIIIAHRLSTVVDTDKIYLIDKGRIVESGTHEEMMKINGLYAKMFYTQKSLYERKEDQ